MSKKTYKHLSEAEFIRIKAMLDIPGITPAITMQVSGRSYPTVIYVKQAADFADYARINREAKARRTKKVEPIATEVIRTEPTVYGQMVEVGNKITALHREWTTLVEIVLQKTQV